MMTRNTTRKANAIQDIQKTLRWTRQHRTYLKSLDHTTSIGVRVTDRVIGDLDESERYLLAELDLVKRGICYE